MATQKRASNATVSARLLKIKSQLDKTDPKFAEPGITNPQTNHHRHRRQIRVRYARTNPGSSLRPLHAVVGELFGNARFELFGCLNAGRAGSRIAIHEISHPAPEQGKR